MKLFHWIIAITFFTIVLTQSSYAQAEPDFYDCDGETISATRDAEKIALAMLSDAQGTLNEDDGLIELWFGKITEEQRVLLRRNVDSALAHITIGRAEIKCVSKDLGECWMTGEILAFTYVDQPYVVHLCIGNYEPQLIENRYILASIIIHEFLHFDIVSHSVNLSPEIYGRAACELAQISPEDALQNAMNYQLFALKMRCNPVVPNIMDCETCVFSSPYL